MLETSGRMELVIGDMYGVGALDRARFPVGEDEARSLSWGNAGGRWLGRFGACGCRSRILVASRSSLD